MSKFKVGDRVRVIAGERWRGVVCTIIRDLCRTNITLEDGNQITAMAYRVDIEPDKGFSGVSFRPEYLEPYYDGNDKVSWSSCVWQPSSVRA